MRLAQTLLSTRGMNSRIIKPALLVLLLSGSAVAQAQRDRPGSVDGRARLEPLIVESAKRYGIDARVLWALCFVESRFKLNSVSPKGARGPMQFMPETAARYGLSDPSDPKAAIDAGARYLRDLLLKFNGRLDLALAAYNAGEGAVESFRTGKPLILRTGRIINPRGMKTGGIPPYQETQTYVRSILNLSMGRNLFSRVLDQRIMNLTASKNGAEKKILIERRISSSFIEVEP